MHYRIYHIIAQAQYGGTLDFDTSVNAGDTVPKVDPRAALALMQSPGREARVLDHLCELGLGREPADALDEVLV